MSVKPSTIRAAQRLADERGHDIGDFTPSATAGGGEAMVAFCASCGGEVIAGADGQTSARRLCRPRP